MTAVAVLGVIILIVFMGMEKGMFTRKFDLDFIAPTGTGFIEGMPVKLSGFVIGRVNKLELTDKAEVRVTVGINMKYRGWLTIGTKARLIKEGFIGDAVVEFVPGIYGGFNLEDGDRIDYETVAGIEEFIREATPVLLEIKGLIEYANDPDGDLKVAIRNLHSVTGELSDAVAGVKPALDEVGVLARTLSSPTGEFRTALGSLASLSDGLLETRKELDKTLAEIRRTYGEDGTVSIRATETLENIRAITAALEPAMEEVRSIISNVDRFSENLPAMGEEVESVFRDLKSIMADIKKATPHIEQVLIDAEGVVSEGLGVIEGVKTSWPVKDMVEAPARPGVIPLDAPLGVGAGAPAEVDTGADAGGGE